MTNQHRATPEQWESIERYADSSAPYSCFLELRARVELLEATQHAHIDTSRLSDEERDQIRQDLAKPARVFATAEATQQRPPHQDKLDRLIALDRDADGEPIVLPSSPAGSLVERVGNRMPLLPDGRVDDASARAAILEVAAWLRSEYPRREGYGTAWANLIEQEANR